MLRPPYTEVMSVHVSEATVDPQGRVILDHLPFQPGEKVDVVIRSHKLTPQPQSNLKGSVIRYENPFEPDGNWVGRAANSLCPKISMRRLPPEVEDSFSFARIVVDTLCHSGSPPLWCLENRARARYLGMPPRSRIEF